MPDLARLYDFTPATTIVSAEVDAEFNQLVELLTGVKINSPVRLTYNNSDAATLTLDNTGAGSPLVLRVGGATKITFNATGQMVSAVATGTAPLVIASTTVVDNLNVDQVDGLHGTQFVRNDASGGITAVDPYFDFIDSDVGAKAVRLQNDGTKFDVIQTTDDPDLVLLSILNDGSAATFLGQVRSSVAAPAGASDLTRKDYVDARFVRHQIGAYFDGAPGVGQKSYVWTAPANVGGFTAEDILLVCQMASGGSGTTTFEVRKYVADFSSDTLLGTVNVTGAVTNFKKATTNINPDVAVAAGEHLVITCTAVGTHQNISVTVTVKQVLS